MSVANKPQFAVNNGINEWNGRQLLHLQVHIKFEILFLGKKFHFDFFKGCHSNRQTNDSNEYLRRILFNPHLISFIHIIYLFILTPYSRLITLIILILTNFC